MATTRALSSFAALGRIIPAGTEVDTSDPLVARFPALFDAAPAAPVVEQATAAPGEVRTTTPRKATARKATEKRKG